MSEPPTANILIVEDDEEIANLLEEGLSLIGNYRISKALSGHEALEKVRSEPPDIILLDIMMIDMDGTEICRAIKGDKSTSHIPVIAVTVIHKGETKRYRDIIESGVDEHVEKPFSFDELNEIIKRFLKAK